MKKLGLIALILVIFAAGIYLVTPKKKAPTTSKKPQTSQVKQYKRTADTDKKDQQIVDNMSEMLTIIANYYSVNHQNFPDGNAKGWQQIMAQVPTNDAFINPYTKSYYAYSSADDLDYGQLQYAPNNTCSSKNGFIGDKYRSLAMRARTIAGIRCVSLDVNSKTE